MLFYLTTLHLAKFLQKIITTVKQLHSNEIISIDFISSKDNLTDSFTKSLSEERINCASKGMGLKKSNLIELA